MRKPRRNRSRGEHWLTSPHASTSLSSSSGSWRETHGRTRGEKLNIPI